MNPPVNHHPECASHVGPAWGFCDCAGIVRSVGPRDLGLPLSGFDGLLEVREDGDYWRLTRPLTYTGARDTWTIPVGFRTDLASVPRLLTWLVPRSGVHNRAAVVHDYLCRRPDVSYRDADGVLRRICRELGVSPQRRWLMWVALRVAYWVGLRRRRVTSERRC